MKKIFIITVLLALVLVTAFALTNDSSVTFKGVKDKFEFLPGSEYSDSDLFSNFKNVMPGDELQQTVHVKNGQSKKVKLYMRAEGASEEDIDFLNQLHLTVTSKEKTIFDAPAGERAQLTENTLLGYLSSNGEVELTVNLIVPIDMGNEYMNRIGTVPWTFIVEEIPEIIPDPPIPLGFGLGANEGDCFN